MALDVDDKNVIYNSPNQESSNKPTSKLASTSWSIAKVFMYMFMFILISGVVAAGMILIINQSLYHGADPEMMAKVYLGLLIGSAIGLFILMLVINFVLLRGRHSVLVPGIIYSTLVGILLSSVTLVLVANFGETDGLRLIGMAFGITCGTYLIMSFIAFLSKGNMNVYLIAISGLFIGSIALILLNLFLRSSMISWIISFAIFALIIFTTIYDLHNMKRIAESGQMTRNLELYCAFNLYVDFINIFLRVLYYLIIIFGRRK